MNDKRIVGYRPVNGRIIPITVKIGAAFLGGRVFKRF